MWSKVLDLIDSLVDRLSMYRLLLYYLLGLVLVAIILSAVGVMHYSALDIGASAAVLVFACWAINRILATIFDAPINPESSILTGLILALIVPSKPTGFGLLFLIAVSGLAMASKYLLAIRSKHIFNPAAIAVVLTAFGPHQSASWWVATASMLPFVLIGGVLLVRKLRRGPMVIAFLLATTIATGVFSLIGGSNLGFNLQNMILNSAVLFLGFVMLTEPYSSPSTRANQLWYAVIVGVVLAPQFHIGHDYSTPEFALIIGNIFAYLVSSKVKLFPTLYRKYKIARDTAEFEFVPHVPLSYLPGQYMEFTLPHDHPDSRGSRRYFTLSSSPTEDKLKVGVKFYDVSSSYKSALIDIDQNSQVVAAQLAGDFVLPKAKQDKLVFIAGGIGITPFRSMIKYLIDTNDRRDIILLYGVREEVDIAYRNLFEEARTRLGIKSYYVLSGSNARITLANTLTGKINARVIKSIVPDINERHFYISGTHQMVEAIQATLHHSGVNRANIKIDFFPGYAWALAREGL